MPTHYTLPTGEIVAVFSVMVYGDVTGQPCGREEFAVTKQGTVPWSLLSDSATPYVEKTETFLKI